MKNLTLKQFQKKVSDAMLLKANPTDSELGMTPFSHKHDSYSIATLRLAHWIKVTESFEATYPLLLNEIGKENFKKLIEDYLNAKPLKGFFTYQYYGEFIDFLKAKKYSDFLIKITEVDWLKIKAISAVKEDCLDADYTLAEHIKAAKKIYLSKYAYIIETHFALDEFLKLGKKPESLNSSKKSNQFYWLLQINDGQSKIESITESQFKLCQNLQKGLSQVPKNKNDFDFLNSLLQQNLLI